MTLEGGGLVDLPRADRPLVFTEPASLSFQDLNVSHRSVSRALVVRVTDAGDGAGTWQVQLAPQSTSDGASLNVPPALFLPPGGEADLVAVARGSADAAAGEDYGFILLRRGEDTRKIPYEFFVGRPQLGLLQPKQLERFQLGERAEPRLRVLLSGRTVRPAARLRGPHDERDRHGDALRHEHRQAGREPRRRSRNVERWVDHRPVVPRLPQRARRAGIRRNSSQRQRADARLQHRHRLGGSIVPEGAALLRLGRLRLGRLHAPVPSRPLRAPLMGERCSPAADPALDEARRRRPSDDRRPGDRQGRRRRPPLARDRVPRRARRRCAVRPDLGNRDLPAAAAGSRDSERQHSRNPHRV